MTSIQERVAKGAAWLDTVNPGWRDAIDLGALDVSEMSQCVCGQVFAGTEFPDVLRMIDPQYVNYSTTPGAGIDYGFTSSIPCENVVGFDREYRDLTAEWRRVIHSSRVPAETQEPSHVR